MTAGDAACACCGRPPDRPDWPLDPAAVRRRLRRLARRHRRSVAAVLTAVAVLAGLAALQPAAPPSAPVVVAAGPLAAGTLLTPADLRVIRLSRGAQPAGALADPAVATGRVLAAPVTAGEPLTDVRLLGPALVPAGLVAVPLPLADPATAALLGPGDLVDLFAAGDGQLPTRPLASGVRVLAVGVGDPGLVVLAVPTALAAPLVGEAAAGRLAFALRG